MNPLINIPESNANCPIHIMITKPGAIAGSDEQRAEIGHALPSPAEGKMWAYQPIAAQPLRFSTMANADLFLKSIADKRPTDEYFVAPMVYNQKRQKWCVNINWAQAVGELVVFAQVDAPKGPVIEAAPEAINGSVMD